MTSDFAAIITRLSTRSIGPYYGVAVGGCQTHAYSLDLILDAIMGESMSVGHIMSCRVSLFCYLFLISLAPAHAQSKTPLVFLPGFAGSYLCERGNNLARIWPGNLDHYKLRLPMNGDWKADALPHVPCGILREPARLFGFRVSDVYGKFADHLRNQLASGVPFVEFSYDWRLSVEHNARQLQARLNQGELVGKPVDIVAHSFGGLVARYYIQNLGGEDKVRQLITMGTPHRGSVDTFETLFEGWGGSDASFKDSAIGWWMGGPAELRKTLLSFPGFYDMLPSFNNCCWFTQKSSGREQTFRAFDPASWGRFAFHSVVFKSDADRAFLATQLQKADKLHRETLAKPLPGLHREGHRLIVTGWIQTATRVYLDDQTGERVRYDKKQGDGTVPLFSATDARDTREKSLYFAPGEHKQIFMEKSALETVARALVGGQAAVGGSQPNIQIRSNDERTLDVGSLTYAVSPGAVAAGDRLKLEIVLEGEEQVGTADLSNISARVLAPGAAMPTLLQLKAEGERRPHSIKFVAEFVAPSTLGAHLVLIRIPGLAEDYKDVFMVLAK